MNFEIEPTWSILRNYLFSYVFFNLQFFFDCPTWSQSNSGLQTIATCSVQNFRWNWRGWRVLLHVRVIRHTGCPGISSLWTKQYLLHWTMDSGGVLEYRWHRRRWASHLRRIDASQPFFFPRGPGQTPDSGSMHLCQFTLTLYRTSDSKAQGTWTDSS